MPAAWHSPSVPGSRSCSRTSRGRRGSSDRWGPPRGRPSSPGTTPSCGRRSRAPAASWSRPRATRSSRRSRSRSTPCAARPTPSAPSPAKPWPDGGRDPGPDGPPPRRGPPARGPRARRPGGLRRHRRQLRRADRERGERRPGRRVRRARRALCPRSPPTASGDVELRLEACGPSRTSTTRCRLYRLVVPGAADDPRPLRTTEIPSNLPGRGDDVRRSRRRGRGPGRRAAGEPGRDADRARWQRQDEARARRRRAPSGRRFPHGVWFVDLAAVQDAAQLEPSVAGSLGIRESTDRTVDEALRVHLRERSTLLVLDNLEQLLPAVAERVADLVRGAPELRRAGDEPRGAADLAASTSTAVPPLEVEAGVVAVHRSCTGRAPGPRPRRRRDGRGAGDLGAAGRAPAGARARGRARPAARAGADPRSAGSGASTSAGVRATCPSGSGPSAAPSRGATSSCRRRSAACSPGSACSRAAGTPRARSRSRTRTAASGSTSLDGLESLVDKSLVRVDHPAAGGEPRFGLHPLLREYALERLEEAGEREAVERRFVALCAEIAAAAGARMLGPDALAWLARLDTEDRNLRAAVDWSLAHGRARDRVADRERRLALVPPAGPAARGPCAARRAPGAAGTVGPGGAHGGTGGPRWPRLLARRLPRRAPCLRGAPGARRADR